MTQQQIELPTSWKGTRPEYAVFVALTRMGIDFDYQSSFMGGRMDRGGAVVDFLIPDQNLAINIQSLYWHYQRPSQMANDLIQRLALEGMGLQVIYIDEEDALRAPFYFVREALAGRDHSRMTR